MALWKKCSVYENTNNRVVYKTLSYSAWSESRVHDAKKVSDVWKGVPTVKTTSATKPKVEICQP